MALDFKYKMAFTDLVMPYGSPLSWTATSTYPERLGGTSVQCVALDFEYKLVFTDFVMP